MSNFEEYLEEAYIQTKWINQEAMILMMMNLEVISFSTKLFVIHPANDNQDIRRCGKEDGFAGIIFCFFMFINESFPYL